MALNRTALRSHLEAMYLSIETNTDPQDARQKLLDGLTDVILLAFTQAQASVQITTVGSATTQQGFVLAPII